MPIDARQLRYNTIDEYNSLRKWPIIIQMTCVGVAIGLYFAGLIPFWLEMAYMGIALVVSLGLGRLISGKIDKLFEVEETRLTDLITQRYRPRRRLFR